MPIALVGIQARVEVGVMAAGRSEPRVADLGTRRAAAHAEYLVMAHATVTSCCLTGIIVGKARSAPRQVRA
jgi:hypothetical protein